MPRTFNGSNYAYIDANAVGTTNFSVSLWMRVTGSLASGPCGFCIGPLNGPSQDYMGMFSSNSSWIGSYKTVGGAAQSAASAISLNTWYHQCGYWRSTSRRSVFAHNDGARYDDTSVVTTDTPGKVIWGGAWYSAALGNGLTGDIAFAGLWGTELSDAEFASLRAGFSPKKIRPQALYDFYPFVKGVNGIRGNNLSESGGPSNNDDPPRIYN